MKRIQTYLAPLKLQIKVKREWGDNGRKTRLHHHHLPQLYDAAPERDGRHRASTTTSCSDDALEEAAVEHIGVEKGEDVVI